MRRVLAALLALALSACATAPSSPADSFFANLSQLCGRAFAGRIVNADAVDEQFADQTLVMHVRACNGREIRIPFHIGDNRSRTWVITRTDVGVRLKHQHRHEDGAEDVLSQYGGDAVGPTDAARLEFPADDFSKRLFLENNLPASVDNVWALELQPGRMFAYELRRPNRHFRVEFDLTRPIPPPPPPWGAH